MLKKTVFAQAQVDIKIPFHDVDLLEVAWHGHYARYFEVARCELFDAIEYNYLHMKASGYAWPVIELHVRYARPACFGETVTVTATLVEIENRLKIDYEVHNADGLRLTRAYTVQVAVDIQSREMCFVSPPILLQKIELTQKKAQPATHAAHVPAGAQ
jgi:acyl-CoA thioester hydrolase